MGAGIPHRAGSPPDPSKAGMWGHQARASSLRGSWGTDGGRDPANPAGGWGAGTLAEVETDLEGEGEGKRSDLERRGSCGQRLSRSPVRRGCLALQTRPGWGVGTQAASRVLMGSPLHYTEKPLEVAWGPGAPSCCPSSPFPIPSPSLSGSSGCGPSQRPGQVVSGLFWYPGWLGSLGKGRGRAWPIFLRLDGEGAMGGGSLGQLGGRVLSTVGGKTKTPVLSVFNKLYLSGPLKLGRGVYLGCL